MQQLTLPMLMYVLFLFVRYSKFLPVLYLLRVFWRYELKIPGKARKNYFVFINFKKRKENDHFYETLSNLSL